ncbi:hypothetical protein VNO78_06321 [Psophocarpus tetragonolobus]|uniref:Uncharacterized protein n=1 Tax=Psophocarpus tetragonolobus TaxID=3891 RepID=A0AAN9SUY5_PSOTE
MATSMGALGITEDENFHWSIDDASLPVACNRTIAPDVGGWNHRKNGIISRALWRLWLKWLCPWVLRNTLMVCRSSNEQCDEERNEVLIKVVQSENDYLFGKWEDVGVWKLWASRVVYELELKCPSLLGSGFRGRGFAWEEDMGLGLESGKESSAYLQIRGKSIPPNMKLLSFLIGYDKNFVVGELYHCS